MTRTRSTGTVHTSAKARLTRIRIRDPDSHQNLIICSWAHCQPTLKMSCKSVRKFLRIVDNKQSNRQTDRHADKQRRKHNLLDGANKNLTKI